MKAFWSALTKILQQPISLFQFTLPFSFQKLLLRFILPFLGIILIYQLVFRLLKGILKNAKVPDETKEKVQRWVRLILRLLTLTGTVLLLGNLLGMRGTQFFEGALRFLNEPLFTAGNTTISILTLMLLIPVFYLSSLAGQWVQHVLKKSVFPQVASLDEAKQFSIAKLARYSIMALVFFILLSIIGVDFSAIGALLAVLGIGVGFGLQDLVSNFFSGIVIIFARQIKEKDRITVDGHEGTVSTIRLLSTSITTLQNENLIIPNSHITNQVIHNASYDNREVILVNPVEVHYDSDMDRVIEVMTVVGEANPFRQSGKAINVVVREFRHSGIAVELRIWIRDVSDKVEALSWVNMELWRAFKKADIRIPYQQVEVHLQEKTPLLQPQRDINSEES